MPGNIIFVKSIQEKVEEDKYYTTFKDEGFSIFMLCPIEFQFCNQEELAACLCTPNLYSGLILTSPRAVESLKVLNSLADWKHKINFAVGEATRLQAQSINLTTRGEESGSATCLCKVMSEGTYEKPFLHPKSNLANDAIESTLASAGINVCSIVAYQTIPSSNLKEDIVKLKETFPAKIIFFSPSGVHNCIPCFQDLNIPLKRFEFYAIGETTARAMEACNLEVAGIAVKPTPSSLLAVVQKKPT